MVPEELLEPGVMVSEEVLEPGVMVREEVLEPKVMVLEEVLELGVMVLEEVLELVAMAQGREARQELELLPVHPESEEHDRWSPHRLLNPTSCEIPSKMHQVMFLTHFGSQQM